MQWRSHTILGFLLAFLVFAFIFHTSNFDALLLGVFSAVSALIPDLDHDSSKGKKLLDLVFIIFIAWFLVLYGCNGNICIPSFEITLGLLFVFIVIIGIYFFIFRFFKPKHRGVTHTMVVCF